MSSIPFRQNLGVQFVRPDVERLTPQYRLISDCLEGETSVKQRGTTYLPNPLGVRPGDCAEKERKARYDAYISRAVFYNATRRTMSGLVGQVYSKEPIVEIPTTLDAVVKSISGDGVSLVQQSKLALENVLSKSRSGLLVDFPQTDGPTSKEQLDSGIARPTVTLYAAEDITNFMVTDIGSEEVLTLVVLRERQMLHKVDGAGIVDPFELEEQTWYRVLRLVNNQVIGEIHKPKTKLEAFQTDVQIEYEATSYELKDEKGTALTRIPFKFIGLTSNSSAVESPAFYDLASLNIAHYRNSADYEESVFLVGQPSYWPSGVDKEWIDTIWGGQLQVGSRGANPLPKGGDVKLLQAAPNALAKEAMDAKERQLVALGAKLVESEKIQKTATEAKIQATAEGSVLQSAAKNVSDAYTWALKFCAKWMNRPDETINFKLNDDFDIGRMSAEERREVVATWQAGGIAFPDMYNVMLATGIAKMPLEEAIKAIKEEQQAASDFEVEKTAALTKATADDADKPPSA